MDLENIEIYGNQTFADLLKRIDKNSTDKAKKIEGLIDQLSDMIESVNDATILVPLVKEYLEIDVKNDEQLIKVATIIQRMSTASMRNSEEEGGGGGAITEAEKEELQKLARQTRGDEENKPKKIEAPKNPMEQRLEELEKETEQAIKEVKKDKS